MTVARSVGDVLTEHVQFEIECIDRMYLNVYVPHLQFAAGLVGYVQRQLGLPIASTAPLAKITDAFSTAVHRFANVNRVPWVDFVKGQRKDDVMREQLEHFTAAEGVVFIGRALEKTALFRTEKRHDANGDSYPWIVKTTGLVNHFYFHGCLRGRRLRPVLPEVLLLLSLQRQAVPQRQRAGQTSGRESGDRVHRPGQRVRHRRRRGGGAGNLRRVGARRDRRAAT
jgi:hypothetical protein